MSLDSMLVQWMTAHGVSAVLAAAVILVLAQLRPALLAAISAWAETLKSKAGHDLVVALVRAAEQIYGGERTAENNAVKLAYVQALAPAATVAEIEAAVHEVKAPLKATATAVIRNITPAQALEIVDKAQPVALARVELAKRMATAAKQGL